MPSIEISSQTPFVSCVMAMRWHLLSALCAATTRFGCVPLLYNVDGSLVWCATETWACRFAAINASSKLVSLSTCPMPVLQRRMTIKP
jgi:hypothetical protein